MAEPPVSAVPAGPVPTPSELAEAIRQLDRRLAAVEAAVTVREEIREDELSRLAWAVKHGRQRPW